ncbi:hypothetical protein T492DRAFT_958187 [Pavlovales sp. CCMP2436]|nr:hypothetical protein T492DRAFT_958187 [Pavlovales sp. CCMP2436]
MIRGVWSGATGGPCRKFILIFFGRWLLRLRVQHQFRREHVRDGGRVRRHDERGGVCSAAHIERFGNRHATCRLTTPPPAHTPLLLTARCHCVAASPERAQGAAWLLQQHLADLNNANTHISKTAHLLPLSIIITFTSFSILYINKSVIFQ